MVKTMLLWIGTLATAGSLAAGAWSVAQAGAPGQAASHLAAVTPYDPLLRVSRVGEATLTPILARPAGAPARQDVTLISEE